MNPKDKHADWLLRPTANDLADEVEMWGKDLLALNMKGGTPVIEGAKLLRQQQADLKDADKYALELERLYEDAKAEIKALNQRIERMIENASHHEGIAHAGGFETGYQAGLKKAQEK